MTYQIFPILIFFLAVFAAILMVLRRLPEASDSQEPKEPKPAASAHISLALKGLPAAGFSKIKHHTIFIVKKIWLFILEAKGIVPTGASVLKIKKLFAAKMRPLNSNLSEETDSLSTQGLSEDDYLAAIKKEPKNFSRYDDLGKFYLENREFSDARDVYLYLTSHASGTADYWARQGFAAFKLKDYKLAARSYEKSLALDSGQPNRYYNLAQSYKATGESQEALKALDKALTMDPQNFKFLELKGRLEKIK